MAKSTINVMFNSYVSLPEGNGICCTILWDVTDAGKTLKDMILPWPQFPEVVLPP